MIVKQIDGDNPDAAVAFIDATPRYYSYKRGGFGGETYNAELHRKPLNGTAAKHCPHSHRSIDAAIRCAERMLRDERRHR